MKRILLRIVDLIANYYAKKGYSMQDEWFSKALTKREFQNKPYLNLARYSNYIKLMKLVKIIEEVENYTKRNRLARREVNILDVGTGATALPALCLSSLGYSVVSVDINERYIASAKQRAKDMSNLKFFVAGGKQFLENSGRDFDIVMAVDVLEHMEEPEEFCKAVYNKLSLSGIFLVVVPDGFSEVELFYVPFLNFLNRVIGTYSPRGATHIQRFSLRRIKEIIKDCGFEYEFISGTFSTRIPFIFAFLFGFRSLPAYLNVKLAGMLPEFMTNSWLVCGIKKRKSAI